MVNYYLILTSILIGSILSDQYLNNSNLLIPFLAAFAVSAISIYLAVPKLEEFKLKQLIREEGPVKHLKKTGTPTMGGLFIIPIGILIGSYGLFNTNYSEEIIVISLLIIGYMCIGFLDDWHALRNKSNKGLSPKEKLICQSLLSSVFLIWAALHGSIDSEIYLLSNSSINVGMLIWPLSLFVLLAESNATNLTDGLDGLAAGCGALVFAGIGIQLMMRSNNLEPALASYCLAMSGSWLGFLMHNKNPAKLFMGDTGSLAMGASLSSLALITNSLWALLIMGGLFLVEALSVIIQVWVFRATKNEHGVGYRVFKMAPIHHHFELKGYQESSIVKWFWTINIVLVILGLAIRSTP